MTNKLVVIRGIEPRSHAYQAKALPLSYMTMAGKDGFTPPFQVLTTCVLYYIRRPPRKLVQSVRFELTMDVNQQIKSLLVSAAYLRLRYKIKIPS